MIRCLLKQFKLSKVSWEHPFNLVVFREGTSRGEAIYKGLGSGKFSMVQQNVGNLLDYLLQIGVQGLCLKTAWKNNFFLGTIFSKNYLNDMIASAFEDITITF